MLAIIETGGKQYTVEPGTIIDIERISVAAGESLSFDTVLMVDTGTDTKLGDPFVPGAAVTATVLSHPRDPKVVVFKFKRKTGYKRTHGHKQHQTTIKVTAITAGDKG